MYRQVGAAGADVSASMLNHGVLRGEQRTALILVLGKSLSPPPHLYLFSSVPYSRLAGPIYGTLGQQCC